MSADVEILRVTSLPATRLQEAATLIADAFVDHPYFMRAFPRKDVRLDACRALYTSALRDGMQHGIVDVASQDRIIGVMISFAPGHYPPTLGRVLAQWREHLRVAALSPLGLIRLFTTKSRFDALHPREPHYYVFAIATDKARRGVANQMAARLFAISDPEGMPVYAETQEQQTLEWSFRIGFRVLREKVVMYPGGPVSWTLLRVPRSTGSMEGSVP